MLGRIPQDQLPRFELAKKGEPEAWNRASVRGGVVHVRHGADAETVRRPFAYVMAKTAINQVGVMTDAAGRTVRFSGDVAHHWERLGTKGEEKTADDVFGRISKLDAVLDAVARGDVRRPNDTRRAYTMISDDGKNGVVVFTDLNGSVLTWHPTFARRDIRRWMQWPEE